MGHQQLYWSHPRKFGQGSRSCRVCSNRHGLIRKYGLNMCRQCFRQYAKDIGFIKKGILAIHLDQVRMEQVLKDACPGTLIALKLHLSDPFQNPPSFSSLIWDIREEDDQLAAQELVAYM
ncbi:hypothetical protein KIL84_007014 [Mauremys mutica]|uniref:Small ribosomal subunit protein uS14 n=1 Tax=Mauremys mutica TaxID=74926 RepID=A0A9D3X125_9SAUR|nr:hypothetical protein KIL84_007014 [Mauremys mutica]